MRCAKGRQEPVASRLWETPAVDLSLPFGCGVSRDGVIDLKTGKLTHQDLGQLQLYVNYYDRERRTEGDGPTLGLILCADKNDAVVRYTLGTDQRKTIFASRYKLHLPSEAELRAELRREVRALSAPTKMGGAK